MRAKLKFGVVIMLSALLSSCWTKLGDLSVASNRLIDDKTEYVELARYITGKGMQKKKSTGALENAVEDCIKQVPNGEFLKNVTVDISDNGRRVKIKADVWGKKTENYVAAKENIKGFSVGDRVQLGKRVGVIISLVDERVCLVQYDGDAFGTKLQYESLIKIDNGSNTVEINGGNNNTNEVEGQSGYKTGDMVQFTCEDCITDKIITGKIVSISTDGSTANVEYTRNNKFKTETVAINKLSKMGGN